MLMPDTLVEVFNRYDFQQVIHVPDREFVLQFDIGCFSGADDSVDVLRDIYCRNQLRRQSIFLKEGILYSPAMVKKSKLTLNTWSINVRMVETSSKSMGLTCLT